MNVLYVLHETLSMAGSAKSFKIMMSGLMQHGISPIVVMPDNKGIYDELSDWGIRTIVIPYRYNTYPWVHSAKDVLLFFPRLIARRIVNGLAVKKIVRDLKDYDVQLVHTNVSVCGIGYAVSRKLGVPHIYHIREYADKDHGLCFFPTKDSFLCQLMSPNSYNICITKDIQRYFQQAGRSVSRVIYNGIHPSMDAFPQNTKERFFLYAGRVVAIKGVLELVKAYNIYNKRIDNAMPLYIIGEKSDANYYNNLVSYIQKHHLEACVKILGQKDDIQDYMRRAWAIVIPSPCEGFGRCMPEAMFCGCLAIGHNTGGTMEQMDNGRELAGGEIALRYETEAQLADLLYNVSNRPFDDYLPYLQRAFTTVNQLYTSESYVNNVFQFYTQILSHSLVKQ